MDFKNKLGGLFALVIMCTALAILQVQYTKSLSLVVDSSSIESQSEVQLTFLQKRVLDQQTHRQVASRKGPFEDFWTTEDDQASIQRSAEQKKVKAQTKKNNDKNKKKKKVKKTSQKPAKGVDVKTLEKEIAKLKKKLEQVEEEKEEEKNERIEELEDELKMAKKKRSRLLDRIVERKIGQAPAGQIFANKKQDMPHIITQAMNFFQNGFDRTLRAHERIIDRLMSQNNNLMTQNSRLIRKAQEQSQLRDMMNRRQMFSLGKSISNGFNQVIGAIQANGQNLLKLNQENRKSRAYYLGFERYQNFMPQSEGMRVIDSK